jgi:hypothetical protein
MIRMGYTCWFNLCHALSGLMLLLNPHPGRCPGLICNALSGLDQKGIHSIATQIVGQIRTKPAFYDLPVDSSGRPHLQTVEKILEQITSHGLSSFSLEIVIDFFAVRRMIWQDIRMTYWNTFRNRKRNFRLSILLKKHQRWSEVLL